MSNEWTVCIISLCTIIEGVIAWLVARIAIREAKSYADLSKRVKKIEEVLRENKLLEPETILFSRRTGA